MITMRPHSFWTAILASSLYAALGVPNVALSAEGAITPVRIGTGTTLDPITKATLKAYESKAQHASIVQDATSATGLGTFCKGALDVAEASRAITPRETEECKKAGVQPLELPVALDALTLIVNPRNALNQIDVEQLRTAWRNESQGKVRTWQQIDATHAKDALKLYGPVASSGSAEFFASAVLGKGVRLREDYTASADDALLAETVARDLYALGVVSYPYYLDNKRRLKALAISPQAGKPGVLPSPETILAGTYQPLTRPMYLYVNVQSLKREEVRDYVGFYLKNAARIIKEVRYVPLSDADYKRAQEAVLKAAN